MQVPRIRRSAATLNDPASRTSGAWRFALMAGTGFWLLVGFTVSTLVTG